MGKAQNVVSRLEDPDYGKMSLATLLEVAAAFDLPLWIDMPNWEEWLRRIKEVPDSSFKRSSFDAKSLIAKAHRLAATSLYQIEESPFEPIMPERFNNAPSASKLASIASNVDHSFLSALNV